MALRRSSGFTRYALSVQYRGTNFLGFSRQGSRGENCVTSDGADLRGRFSVETRLLAALSSLTGEGNHEHFQVSSRTDRGVHAWRNTAHVDVRPRKWQSSLAARDELEGGTWDPRTLQRGLNFYLAQQCSDIGVGRPNDTKRRRDGQIRYINDGSSGRTGAVPPPAWLLSQQRAACESDLRVLSAAPAPAFAPNEYYDGQTVWEDEPPFIDWNARFTASSRTYVYRILHLSGGEKEIGAPFERDRAWTVCTKGGVLDVAGMNEAAEHLVGLHNFSSFRGKTCQRPLPVTRLTRLEVASTPYGAPSYLGMPETSGGAGTANVVTITIQGESFLYRQVRNIVGCLARVGQGKMKPRHVKDLLEARNRALAPDMAPAHGLYLVDVEHGDFKF